MGSEETVTLHNLAGGAAAELFQAQVDRVVQNVLDPNMPAKAKRRIVLEVTIEPDEDRSLGAVSVSCTAKLPTPRGARTTLYFGKLHGRPVAVENDPRQGGLFDQAGSPVVAMPRKENGK